MNLRRTYRPLFPRLFLLSGALFVVVLAGCDRHEIQVYRVGKEPAEASTAQAGALPAGHPEMGASGPPLTWTLPAGWEEQTPGEMRLASFSIKENGKQADVSVVPLGGTAGGDLANVNRWRGQVGLSPVSDSDLKSTAEKVEAGGQPADLYDLSGKNPGSGEPMRILAAVQHRDGRAWFFKMTGDDDLVLRQKPSFVVFLKSLRFESEASPALPASHPPVEGMGGGAKAVAAGEASSGQPEWQVPAGWQSVAAGQFLIAKFVVNGEGKAQASINVSVSPGTGGGVAANVNRWRKQLGLAEVSEEEVNRSMTPLEVAGRKALVVDLTGTDAMSGQPTRLAAAIVSEGDKTWFYKLMGDAAVVQREHEAFTGFVRSTKY